MKAVHILSSGTFSGAEKVAVDIIELTKNSINAAYASPNGEIAEVLKEKNIDHILMKDFSPAEVKAVIRETESDIIHAHDFRAAVYSAFSKKRNNYLIAHIHNNNEWLKKLNINSFLYLLASMNIDQVINVSESIEEEYIFKQFLMKKSTVLENTIDSMAVRIQSERTNVEEKYDLIFLGRLANEKAPERFVEIVNGLKNDFPYIRTCIVGKGPMEHDCRLLINKYDLIDNIKLLGYQKNPFPYLKNSKILVICSRWEGFGLAAVEALALGKPVIAANVGGLANIISSEVGSLCGTDEEFIRDIKTLLTDTSLYTGKSANALLKSKDYSNRGNYASRILDLYNASASIFQKGKKVDNG